MKFRFARHTNNLEKLKSFYTEVLGLEILGGFQNHNNYDGVFIGKSNENWHLEFTQNQEKANHTFDDDDILVFYPKTNSEFELILLTIQNKNIKFIESKNPYWNENSKLFLDPDGYRIVISNLKIML